jgi:8-oxo-dGTP pyrophosphatase MutT (NUDIX family)
VDSSKADLFGNLRVMTDSAKKVLPNKPAAAGCLFSDDSERLLFLRPTYKEFWEVPGGVVEDGESPKEACRREIIEELGFDHQTFHLLCVDYRSDRDAYRFLFDGGKLSEDDIRVLRLQEDEIAEYAFLTVEEITDRLQPALARRITVCVGRGSSNPLYLEDGMAV